MTPLDRSQLAVALDRAKTYVEDSRLVIEYRVSLDVAKRLAASLCVYPRRNGDKWRVRIRGARAEALAAELLPLASEEAAAFLRAALEKLEAPE